MRAYLRKFYNYVSRILGIRFLYETLIQPINSEPDIYRKEYVLNTILVVIMGILVLLGVSITWSLLFPHGEYSGIPISLFVLLGIYFGTLLVLSRKGYWFVSSCLLVASLFIVTLYAVLQWSFVLPMIILGAVLIIVIAGILFSSRIGLVITTCVVLSIASITYLQLSGFISVNTQWRADPISVQDVIEMGIIFFAVNGISWLSNRETYRSLKRARLSEQALIIERNLLEIKVEERTRELKELQAQQVAELQHLASLGDRSSGIFHDLMTPLTSIIALVDELPTNNAQLATLKPDIEKAVRASKRIGQQLSIIRKEVSSDGGEHFIPDQEIQDAVDILSYQARKHHVRCVITESCTLRISGSPILFHRILTNLISNAIDSYTQSSTPTERVVLIAATAQSGFLIVTITDHGTGIPQEHQSKIFDPFFTTKTGKGLGIGLGHTKQNIEKYFNGTIKFTSSAQGTTFTVTLPIT